MGRAILFPTDFADYSFEQMLRTESHPRNRQRLLAMAHLQDGKSIQIVSKIVKVHWKTVQSWLYRFRQQGLEGLFESPRCGAPRKMTSEQESWLTEKITKLSTAPDGGYITGKMLHDMMSKEAGLKCSVRTVYYALHRLDFRWITSRSKHPKSDQGKQDDYKKNLLS